MTPCDFLAVRTCVLEGLVPLPSSYQNIFGIFCRLVTFLFLLRFDFQTLCNCFKLCSIWNIRCHRLIMRTPQSGNIGGLRCTIKRTPSFLSPTDQVPLRGTPSCSLCITLTPYGGGGGVRGSVVVALCYKPEGLGFYSIWGYRIFQLN
jgi:hypothetical protein